MTRIKVPIGFCLLSIYHITHNKSQIFDINRPSAPLNHFFVFTEKSEPEIKLMKSYSEAQISCELSIQ